MDLQTQTNTNTQTQPKPKIKNFDAIIYHGPCSDGTGGLWSAIHYANIQNRCACKAGANPPPNYNYTDMNIIFIDICPTIDYLTNLVSIAKNIVILDHHISSKEMIESNSCILEKFDNLFIEFDMERSGCQMAWDYFFDNSPRPFFIDYIGDRDLWHWKLPNSKEINNALFELNYVDPRDLTKLSDLLNEPDKKMEYLRSAGDVLEIAKNNEISVGVSNSIEAVFEVGDVKYRVWLGGNVNPTIRSELGNVLCAKKFNDGILPDFSVVWQYVPISDEWWISLRGNKERSPDLSSIASSFGGGGHKFASGFTIRDTGGLKHCFTF